MRILHAADFHLDSAFRGLSAEKAAQRRRESRELLERLRQLAEERQAELVLLSGDLFDSAHAYRETLEQLSRTLGAMPCPVCIAPGNHDPYGPGSPYRDMAWPENVHIFTSPAPSRLELEHCVVYGAAFTAPRQEESLLRGFTAPEDPRPSVMCLHGDVNGGPYNPITREEIAASGLTYLALGHVHQYSGLERAGNTYYAYPGCPEGRGFDELGEKGVLLLEMEGSKVSAELIPLCRRCYRILTADVTGREVRQAAEETLVAAGEEDIVRLVLTGETDRRGVEEGALLTALAPRFFSLEIRDETRMGTDLWSRAGEDSLRGIFLQELKNRYDAAQEESEKRKIAMAARFGLAAMDDRDW